MNVQVQRSSLFRVEKEELHEILLPLEKGQQQEAGDDIVLAGTVTTVLIVFSKPSHYQCLFINK